MSFWKWKQSNSPTTNLSPDLPDYHSRDNFPLLKKEHDVEMNGSFIQQEKTIHQRKNIKSMDKEKELFQDSEIDKVNISRAKNSKRRFPNGVFFNNQASAVFETIDVGQLTFKTQHRKIKALSFLTFLFVVHVCVIFKLVYFPTSRFSQSSEMNSVFNEAISSVVNNLKLEPILDIQLIELSLGCPNGYENMLFGEWPATFARVFSNGQLLKQNIPKVDPIQLSTWKGMRWCVKRAQVNQDYLKLCVCPKGFVTCSFGLCMKESLPCPITSINSTGDSFTFWREIERLPLVRVEVEFLQKTMPRGWKSGLNEEIDQQKAEIALMENKVPEELFNLSILKEISVVFYQTRQTKLGHNEFCLDPDYGSDALSELKDSSNYLIFKLIEALSIIYLVIWIILGWASLKFKSIESLCFRKKIQGALCAFVQVYLFAVLFCIFVVPTSSVPSCFLNPGLFKIASKLKGIVFPLQAYLFSHFLTTILLFVGCAKYLKAIEANF